MGLLSDQTAVVTGAASGNGRGIAQAFGEHGADVVVADIREDPRLGGTPTHEWIKEETDASATFVECDVTDPEQSENAVETAEEFGGIDVMVNNAGVIQTIDFLDMNEEDYHDLMEVNTKGVFFGAQAAAKRMVENGSGCIINISSIEGMRGLGIHPIYDVSKGGVKLLTYMMADALGGTGVRVNAIHPGLIDTAMTEEDDPIIGTDREEQYLQQIPRGRIGKPEDVGKGAVFLASDLADYVHGESLLIDGGLVNTQ